MESIEQMIKRLCPKGVEYVKLGEVCEIMRGKRLIKKELFEDAKFKVFHGGLSPIGYYTKSNRQAQTVMIINVGASAGTVGFCEEEFWSSDGCFCLSHNDSVIHSKYLYYYLAKHQISIQSRVRKAGIPTLDAGAVMDILIPLPPLEIQSRIVEVLDKMTTLTAELEAELEARKQQYEYYRNKLLIFNEMGGGIRQVTWKKISEIAHYPKARIKSEMLTIDTYVGVESLVKNRGGKTSSASVPEGASIEFLPKDILIGNIRPYLKKIWFSNCQGGTNGDVICIRVLDGNEVMPKFLYYILSSDAFFDYDNSHAKGGKMPRGDKDAIFAYNVPIPPLSEQQRIVSMLDRFEALTTDLQSGLPAEIEARRQQYEYYRNKLLTFEAV